MIDKQSVMSLIDDCELQQQYNLEAIEDYKDDSDQVTAFNKRIEMYQFMINRLQRFL